MYIAKSSVEWVLCIAGGVSEAFNVIVHCGGFKACRFFFSILHNFILEFYWMKNICKGCEGCIYIFFYVLKSIPTIEAIVSVVGNILYT